MVEACIGELQAERVLPIDPGAHRVGRLAAAREQSRELPVLVHAAQHVGDAQAGTTLRKRGLRYAPRLFAEY